MTRFSVHEKSEGKTTRPRTIHNRSKLSQLTCCPNNLFDCLYLASMKSQKAKQQDQEQFITDPNHLNSLNSHPILCPKDRIIGYAHQGTKCFDTFHNLICLNFYIFMFVSLDRRLSMFYQERLHKISGRHAWCMIQSKHLNSCPSWMKK